MGFFWLFCFVCVSLTKTGVSLKVKLQQRNKLETEEKQKEEFKKKMEESMEKAEKAYYKALEEMPTASELMDLQVSE